MFEYFSISGLRWGWDALRSGWRFWNRNNRQLTPAQKLALRQKWKDTFHDRIYIHEEKGYGLDAIMRDMRRIDEYPGADGKSKKISSWFRFGLVGTYERGFLALLFIGTLVEDPKSGKWRYADWKNREEGEKFFRIGYVPYEFVESVDWNGDIYYNNPHVFCYFDGIRGTPYERISYCQTFMIDKHTYYKEMFADDEIRKNSKAHGLKWFG